MALGLPFKSLSFNGRVECSGITTWVSLFQSVGLWNVLAARSGSNVSSRWRAADKKTLFIFRCLSFEVRHRHTNGHNFDEQRVKPVNVSQRESNYTFHIWHGVPIPKPVIHTWQNIGFFSDNLACVGNVCYNIACVLSRKKLHWFL